MSALGVTLLATAVPPCFPVSAGLDDFRQTWYCKHLRAAGEVPLPPGVESYRFLYLRTFHRPLSVRVQRVGDRWLLSATELSGRGGYEPGTPARRIARELSGPEVATLQRRLSADFWGELWVSPQGGMDGAQWILEGQKEGNYRIQDLWSPDGVHYERFRRLCLFFLELAGLTPSENEVY